MDYNNNVAVIALISILIGIAIGYMISSTMYNVSNTPKTSVMIVRNKEGLIEGIVEK